MSEPRHAVNCVYGLVAAGKMIEYTPDPPGLENIVGRNRHKQRFAAKLIHIMCDGQIGCSFFLGCESLASTLNDGSVGAAHRVLRSLEAAHIIKRTWTGGLLIRNVAGEPYAGGIVVKDKDGNDVRRTPRANEYIYLGLPTELTCPGSMYQATKNSCHT